MRNPFLFAAAALVATSTLTACSNPKAARQTLAEHNLKPLEVGGHDVFGCGVSLIGPTTKFRAVNAKGKLVSGVVCEDFLLGPVVHLEGDGYDARETLLNHGLEPIKTSSVIYGCARQYYAATEFQAVDAKGKSVTGIVCTNILRGNSVRLYKKG